MPAWHLRRTCFCPYLRHNCNHRVKIQMDGQCGLFLSQWVPERRGLCKQPSWPARHVYPTHCYNLLWQNASCLGSWSWGHWSNAQKVFIIGIYPWMVCSRVMHWCLRSYWSGRKGQSYALGLGYRRWKSRRPWGAPHGVNTWLEHY